MKCEKCGNEAVYHYRETVNGKTTEKHLCLSCAHEEGLDRIFDRRENDLFGELERSMQSFFEPDDFFGDFFAPRRSLGGMARTMLAPMLRFPRIEIRLGEPEQKTVEQETEQEQKAAVDEGLNRRRELNELRHKLKEAVRAEDYEQCITLRDRIRKLEEKSAE